jgi:hypothetical protein
MQTFQLILQITQFIVLSVNILVATVFMRTTDIETKRHNEILFAIYLVGMILFSCII